MHKDMCAKEFLRLKDCYLVSLLSGVLRGGVGRRRGERVANASVGTREEEVDALGR